MVLGVYVGVGLVYIHTEFHVIPSISKGVIAFLVSLRDHLLSL